MSDVGLLSVLFVGWTQLSLASSSVVLALVVLVVLVLVVLVGVQKIWRQKNGAKSKVWRQIFFATRRSETTSPAPSAKT